ncbi:MULTISPECIES: cell division protein FtsL [Thermoanaerobacterium]|uniref:Cell division protein FtsL n=1 Tax=Thermoanaerobacterium xylanolyticum (strain ATCC 49914 / DSM 7097 / LX-11) TaxID=858215 RepID=F6BK95_THEXL|nr:MULTISPECIES: cell division protein FtsL [Thermoanaerobacterium]AEF17090.1 cell division protein FtsL [Thermoanaerobacterium xylanolyticum LX-11]MDE4542065.1 cell division protein FtsL [Thermoanaerobacterium sp. R66]
MVLEKHNYDYDLKPYYEENKGKKTKKNKKLKNLAVIVFVGFLSLTVLFRYALIYQKSVALSSVEAKASEIEKLNQQLEVQIASMSDLQRIEEIAKNQLGMVEPDKGQIVYMSVGKQNQVAEKKTDDENKNKTFWGRILGLLVR